MEPVVPYTSDTTTVATETSTVTITTTTATVTTTSSATATTDKIPGWKKNLLVEIVLKLKSTFPFLIQSFFLPLHSFSPAEKVDYEKVEREKSRIQGCQLSKHNNSEIWQ
jgi:hypothetical protein